MVAVSAKLKFDIGEKSVIGQLQVDKTRHRQLFLSGMEGGPD